MKIRSRDNDNYYPQPESQGGWRFLKDKSEIKSLTNVSLGKLDDLVQRYRLFFDTDVSGIVIIRNGYLIKEYYSFMTLPGSRFDVWSCTKSFTGIAWGLLLEEGRKGTLPNNLKIDLDSPAYSFLFDKYKVTDKLKERITIAHLLNMTSGIAGENDLVFGIPTDIDCGPLWNYSDPAMAHLSMLFHSIMGQEIHQYMQEKVFEEIGIENASWDVLGGGQFIGPHTCAHIGLHISARELARFGYLLMHQGLWNGKEVIPSWWVETATKSSQQLNPEYGYTFWVNTNGTHWPGLPKDMFALKGYNSNRCYVVPSQDLVVVRVGAGPNQWNEQSLISGVLDAIN